MKKVIINFWVDVFILIVCILLVSTGFLLHRFPHEMSNDTILGLNRYDWGELHWILSILFVTLITVHLILHIQWIKITSQKYGKMSPKYLAIILIAVSLFICFLLPVLLTKKYHKGKNVLN